MPEAHSLSGVDAPPTGYGTGMIEVGLAGSLTHRTVALGALLGPEFLVGEDPLASPGVLVLDEASVGRIGEARAVSDDIGIIVVLDEHDRRDPRSIVAFLEAGANVCVVAPGTAGLAAHIRALAAHRPGAVPPPAAIPA
jgi:hypothetical protein